MGIALLATAAACSFDGSVPTSLSSDSDASPQGVGAGDSGIEGGSDGSVDDSVDAALPSWSVVETMTIDTSDSQPTFSQMVLESGVVYRLRVSGTITNVIGSFEGDADYFDFDDPKDDGCCEDIGLGIDDFVVDDMDTQPDWGPYDPSHVYEVPWTGDGTTIAALFQDTFYGNNIGNLTLEILAFQ
jgi:hypothetical protein